MNYSVKLYNWSTHSQYINSLIKEFHIYGHGIELGMTHEEHLARVTDWMQNHSVLAVYSGDVVVGVVGVCPELQADPHFPGMSLHTSFTVVLPGYPGAALYLYKRLRDVARLNGADWLCTTKRTAAHTYTKRGHNLWAGSKSS